MNVLGKYLIVFVWVLLCVVSCKEDEVIALRDIVFEDYPSRINVGDQIQFVVKLYPENANHNVPTGELHWSNSNPEVCTLSDNGLLTTICTGRTNITAEWDGFEVTAFVEIQDVIEINDKRFYNYVIDKFDTNGDGIIQGLEICEVNELDLSGLPVEEDEVISIKGIELFPQLKKLKISTLTISDLDLSKNEKLEQLICYSCGQETLDLSANTNLWELDCHSSQLLTTIIFPSDPDNNALDILICNDCAIENLDLSACVNLEHIECSRNPMTSLDVSNCTWVKTIKCDEDLNITLPEEPDLQLQINDVYVNSEKSASVISPMNETTVY